ncbi:hypothetical protein FRX31_012976 [Thalictrum thalictroides]|uniref:Ankyrin repeat-containing protein n=1 Tax=Thalictrum thalictroides TaxID=46969 RepID=A0A7J6WMY1_THATH|nr:hypothetical protein FRX31_012976 [Thalictrum thalictroides]
MLLSTYRLWSCFSGMDQSLSQASEDGDINALHAAIERDPLILNRIDRMPYYMDTPLHIAASAVIN